MYVSVTVIMLATFYQFTSKSKVPPIPTHGVNTKATRGPVLHNELRLTESLLCSTHCTRHFSLIISLDPQTTL